MPRLQVNSVLHYQLPPKGLWRWWCGGLSPVDLTVWVFTVALMVMWTWQLTKGYWDYLDGALLGPGFRMYSRRIENAPQVCALQLPGMSDCLLGTRPA